MLGVFVLFRPGSVGGSILPIGAHGFGHFMNYFLMDIIVVGPI